MTNEKEYDVFISFAQEDKEVVDELYFILNNTGLKVWYKEEELKIGDSIVDKINEGLKKSQFGVVVLSAEYLEQKWSKRELNALLQMQRESNQNVILPIRHNISKKTIQKQISIINDIHSVDTSKGVHAIAKEIYEVVKGEKPSEDLLPDKAPFFQGAINCYISCAKANTKGYEELLAYLELLTDKYDISFSSRVSVDPGLNKEEEAHRMIQNANLYLLLMNSGYLKSSTMRKERQLLAELSLQEGKKGIIILASSFGWERYEELVPLVKIPLEFGKPKPIDLWDNKQRAYKKLIDQIEQEL